MAFEPPDKPAKATPLNKSASTAKCDSDEFLFGRTLEDWRLEQWSSVTVVVAVSGGSDSVALLRMLDKIHQSSASAQSRLVVAHFDHGWRDDSIDDSLFVSSLAEELGWECVIGRPVRVDSDGDKKSVNADSPKVTEASAREERYAFLNSVAAKAGARYLLTGHTANDQAETILHRILRGTGLKGLAGIPRFRAVDESLTIYRPLLEIRRDELVTWLDEIGQSYRTDSTNSDEKFTRNRIRHSLMPSLKADFNPEVEAALVRLGQLSGEVHQELQPLVASFVSQHCELHANDSNESVTIQGAGFESTSPLLTREIFRSIWQDQSWPLQAMGFTEWKALEELAWVSAGRTDVDKKTATLPGNVAVIVENGRLVLRRETAKT